MRPTSLVVFDVKIDGTDEDSVEVMRRVFAHRPAIRLRTKSPLIYQSGNYQQTFNAPAVWTGRLDRIRTDPRSNVMLDPGGGYQFIDSEEEVPTSHATTLYAFVPQAMLLVYQDTAEMPYTRMVSYVTGAMEEAREDGFSGHCEVVPRMIERPFREWLQHFSSVDRVRVRYRHSNSPGNRAIDSIMEQLHAHDITETVKARQKEELNKAALLNTELPIGRALNHLELSIKNGDAQISGHVGETRVKFDTKSPVERHMVEIEEEVTAMRSSIGRFALKLLTMGAGSEGRVPTDT